MTNLTQYGRPYLHLFARSRLITKKEIEELLDEESSNKQGTGGDPYYAYGQSQGGAAWHAVEMSRADRGG